VGTAVGCMEAQAGRKTRNPSGWGKESRRCSIRLGRFGGIDGGLGRTVKTVGDISVKSEGGAPLSGHCPRQGNASPGTFERPS